MLFTLLFLAVCFLAWSNGANDNFKGVASLFGSGTCSYRTAINWATATTLAGSVAAIFFASALLKKFSGKGLVPDSLAGSPHFLLAIALGAGITVILATRLGFPISTTHGLTGALIGAGFQAVGSQVNFGMLGKVFVLPLLLSPILAIGVGGVVYVIFRFLRLRLRISKEVCICGGTEQQVLALPQPSNVFAAQAMPSLSVAVDKIGACNQRYAGECLGISAARAVDAAHFLSAGAVSFARGLNDTPKIAALLLVASALDIRWGLVAVAIAMAIGGMLNGRRVAETMAHKITGMNTGQGFAANLATALLVTTASAHGLPVSTTHVSVGALLGIGVTTRQARWKSVGAIVLSWVITLPCAALLAAACYSLIRYSQ
jgi:PiT family inorganic phosphate transporter